MKNVHNNNKRDKRQTTNDKRQTTNDKRQIHKDTFHILQNERKIYNNKKAKCDNKRKNPFLIFFLVFFSLYKFSFSLPLGKKDFTSENLLTYFRNPIVFFSDFPFYISQISSVKWGVNHFHMGSVVNVTPHSPNNNNNFPLRGPWGLFVWNGVCVVRGKFLINPLSGNHIRNISTLLSHSE